MKLRGSRENSKAFVLPKASLLDPENQLRQGFESFLQWFLAAPAIGIFIKSAAGWAGCKLKRVWRASA